MLLHQQVRGDDPLNSSHKLQLQFEVGGFLNQEELAVKHKEYHRTHNLGNPSDIHGTPLSDNLHQKAYYEPQEVNLLLEALFVTILWGIQEHRQYLHGRDHAPENTSNYNSSALAG
jgi:hypothetical protein